MIYKPIIPLTIMTTICTALLIIILIRLKNFRRKIVDIIIVILLFVINLRIMTPSDKSLIRSNNFDVLFVIDNTISMNAEDYNGSQPRLDGVKQDCKYILEKLSGARFSIITFNNNSRILIPYTDDFDLIIDALDSIKPIIGAYSNGSSLNTPHDSIITSLKYSQSKEERKRFVFFISDGEITDNSTLNSYADISEYLDNGAVLGYGTTTGGKMKYDKFINDSQEEYIYVTVNGVQEYAISKIDEDNLKKIASDMNVSYINMKNTSDIDNKLDELLDNLVVTPSEIDLDWYDDTYYYFLIPLILMLIWKFYLTRRGV